MSRAGLLKVSDNLNLPLTFATEATALLARRGAGKSNAGVVICEELYRNKLPFVFIDPKGDSWGIRSSADGESPGLAVPVFGGRHGDVPLEAGSGHMVADLVLGDQSSYLSCVLDVSHFTKADQRRFLRDFGDRLFRGKDETGVLTLILEEAHDYLPQMVKGLDAEVVGIFQRIVKQGRQRGLGCVMLSQRSASLNKDVLTQVGALIPMWTMSPQDRKAIKDWVEDIYDGYRELLNELPHLTPGQAYLLAPEITGKEALKFTFRRRWTFDSGATPEPGKRRAVPRTLADVDLEAVTAAMAETIEKAKAEDPKILRKELAAARAELAAAKARLEEQHEHEIVEISVLEPDDRERLSLLMSVMTDLGQRLDQDGEALWTLLNDKPWRMQDVQLPDPKPARARPFIETPVPGTIPVKGHYLDTDERPARGKVTIGTQTFEIDDQGRIAGDLLVPDDRPVPPARIASIPGVSSDTTPTKAEREILDALGSRYPKPQSAQQLALLTGRSAKGGGFRNSLGSLRTKGLIEGSNVSIAFAERKIAEVWARPPATGAELLVQWQAHPQLGRAARMALAAIVDAYPGTIDAATVAANCDYEATGGGFRNALGQLRTLGLIEGGNQAMRAAEEFGA